nr:NAD(P)H-dependent oxidoreductase [Proteus mirabilis]
MYNFSIFSQLKHSIDFIARAGETFKYTETGSVGLLEDKQVIVLPRTVNCSLIPL